MPSQARNPFLLGMVASGVQFDIGADRSAARPGPSTRATTLRKPCRSTAAGSGSSDLLLDGLSNTGTETSTAANMGFVPSPDAVPEFRIQTSNYDAQYGRTAGGTITVSIKYGTNASRHGLRAREHYHQRQHLRPESHRQAAQRITRTTRFELDGPLVIPHLYDGHNKTFFMYSYEIWRTPSPRPPRRPCR